MVYRREDFTMSVSRLPATVIPEWLILVYVVLRDRS